MCGKIKIFLLLGGVLFKCSVPVVKMPQTVKKEEELTRDEIQKEADRIIDTLDPIGFGQAIQSIRDAAKAAGKSIVDFIRENPALPFAAGLPLGAAVTVPKVRDALGL